MNLQASSAALAFALGLWTAIQPCPMTANLAAVSYLGRRAGTTGVAILTAALYAAGQVVAYVVLALVVLEGIAADWRLATWLQQHVNEVLGPVWMLAGMVLLDLISFRLPGAKLGFLYSPLPPGEGQGVRGGSRTTLKWWRKTAHPRPNPLRVPTEGWSGAGTWISAWGMWSALPLGVVLALGFCPVSAAIFFVDLLAIARTGGSHVVYPAIYALGAALPVLVFAALLSAGSHWLGSALNRTQQVQRWLNRIAGGVLLAVGIYYALRFNFQWPVI